MNSNKRLLRFLVLILLVISLPVSIMLINANTNFLNRAYLEISGKNADLLINLTSTKPYVPNWTFYSQGGESSEGMLTPAIDNMQKLKPKYIRIDHIFDFYRPVGKDKKGGLVFDWEKLDTEIEAINDMGAKPFISLSYMPEVISSGRETDLPGSWENWSQVVKATIEHISGRSGLAIADVYYEVWNEPDLFGSFKLRGAKNYLALYSYASKGAQSAMNTLSFKFGGPATTALYKSWYVDFVKYARDNDLLFDFYSWHRYSAYIRDFETDVANIELWRNENNNLRKEIVISESGHTPEVDDGYDTKFSAIHTLATIAATQDNVDKLFTFEVIDGQGDKKLWGRWGLLTNPYWGKTEEKPRFMAMQFLNKMMDSGISLDITGEGDYVKAFGVVGQTSIKIFIVNYDPKNKHFENVPLLINGLPEGEYNYEYNEFLSEPYAVPILISGSVWKTKLMLRPNTAAIVELTRKN